MKNKQAARVARIVTALGPAHGEEGLTKSLSNFKNSVQWAKLDAMGDIVTTMIEDVREAQKLPDPAVALQRLEQTFKNILKAITEHAQAFKGKAEEEQRAASTKTAAEPRKEYEYSTDGQTARAKDAFELLDRCYAADAGALKSARSSFEAGKLAAKMDLKLPRDVDHVRRGAAEQALKEALDFLANRPGDDWSKVVRSRGATFDPKKAAALLAQVRRADFWKDIEAQLKALQTAKSAADVFRICPPVDGETAANARGFFAGSGGDDTVLVQLQKAGWRPLWVEASYHWAAKAPNGDVITYVEGDLYKGDSRSDERKAMSSLLARAKKLK